MNGSNKKDQNILGKAIIFLILFIFIIAGLYLIRRDYTINRTIEASKAWPITSGEVVFATIEDSYDGEQTTYYPKISYNFMVSGAVFSCDMRANVSSGHKDDPEILNVLESFPIGTIFKVSYNPARPQECVSEYDKGVNFSLVPWAFIAISVFLIISVLRNK